MEVDQFIERHRQRIQQHRQFLHTDDDGAEGHDPHNGEEDEFAPQQSHRVDSNNNHRRSRSSDRHAALSHTLQEALHAAARTDSHAIPAAATPNTLYPTYIPPTRAQSGPVVHHANGDKSIGTPRSASRIVRSRSNDNADLSPLTVGQSGTAKQFYGFAGDDAQIAAEDRVLQQHLSEVGKYFTQESPDYMYERSKWWADSRKQAVDRQRQAVQDRESEQCTFRPNTDRVRGASQNHVSAARSRTPNRGSGEAVEVAHMDHHIQRQNDARRLREEAVRKVEGPDIQHWKHRTTKPVEFKFGKRVQAISSLKQPVTGNQHSQELSNSLVTSEGRRLRDGDEPPSSSSNAAAARHTSPSTARSSQQAPRGSAAATPRSGATSSRPAASETAESIATSDLMSGPAKQQQQQQPMPAEDGDRQLEDAVIIAELRARVLALEQQTAEQTQLIASLRRECDIAKAMVRKFSLES